MNVLLNIKFIDVMRNIYVVKVLVMNDCGR